MATPPPADPAEIADMFELIGGYRVSQALAVAAHLGIPDLLAGGPGTAADLAASCGADPETLYRLLRALTSINILHEDDESRFSTTSLGNLLRGDHPQSMQAMAIWNGHPLLRAAWGDLHGAVVSGDDAFERVHGAPMFDFLATRPADSELFNRAMTSLSRGDLAPLLASIDFSDARRIVDIGGGQGYLLHGILERYPESHGVLFDLPNVVAGAAELRGTPEADRCDFIGGDMFEAVPPGGDTYLMRFILHDWNDEDCVRLLRTCRAAIAPTGRFLGIERVVGPPNTDDPVKWQDLQMLVMQGGRERTAEEFAALYEAGGFTLTRIVPLGRSSVIEGVPA